MDPSRRRAGQGETFAYLQRMLATADTGSGCWEWPFATQKGYGAVRFEGRRRGAHRVVWYLTTGVWPLVCRHQCDNPLCFNPSHLLDGTQGDNVRDMFERTRSQQARDERIVGAYQDGADVESIARESGMSVSGVKKVLARRGQSPRPRGGQGKAAAEREAGRIVAAYEAGHSMESIARMVHCHHFLVRDVLTAAGVKLRPKGKQPAACGTRSGYNRHYRLGEKPCEPCKAANQLRNSG